MQKAIIFSCIIGSAVIILGQFGFFEALLMFFLAGIIPGTHISIPSNVMFLLVIASIAFIITWLAMPRVLDFLHNKMVPSKQPKKHLPKRRFSEI